MSDAFLKSYFAFFQRGTGVILADDPWRVFIELGKNIYFSNILVGMNILYHVLLGTEKQMFPFPKVVNPGCYKMLERFN